MASSRALLWCSWAIATATSLVYTALCLVTFIQLEDINWADDTFQRGVLAATMMSAVLLLLLAVVSPCVILGKGWVRGGTGISYGIMASSYLWMSAFCLLSGIVLVAFKPTVDAFEGQQGTSWSSSDTGLFVGSYIMAFATTGVFLLTFPALIMFRDGAGPKAGASNGGGAGAEQRFQMAASSSRPQEQQQWYNF